MVIAGSRFVNVTFGTNAIALLFGRIGIHVELI